MIIGSILLHQIFLFCCSTRKKDVKKRQEKRHEKKTRKKDAKKRREKKTQKKDAKKGREKKTQKPGYKKDAKIWVQVDSEFLG